MGGAVHSGEKRSPYSPGRFLRLRERLGQTKLGRKQAREAISARLGEEVQVGFT